LPRHQTLVAQRIHRARCWERGAGSAEHVT
jgi:hypothetical protein